MSWDPVRMKSHAAAATAAAVALVGVVGIWLFVVSLRPCRIKLRPGQLVSYRLTTEWSPIASDDTRGEPVVSEQDIDLVCIGGDNEVALVNPGAGANGHDEVTLLDFAPDGTARRFDPTSQVHDEGKALGFFDFNLLPLPPGSEQAWSVSLVYAALPKDQRQVQAKVRRVTNGSSPTFKLTLPAKEWFTEGADKRWHQIKDLACTYRFNSGKGVVESASVVCVAGVETADGYHRYHVRTDLQLVGVTAGKDEPVALRDLALATAEAQDALSERRYERLSPVLQRLAANPSTNERLRAVAQRLLAEGEAGAHVEPRRPSGRGDTPEAVPVPDEAWALQVGRPLASKSAAARLVKALAAAGLPAYVVAKDHASLVLVGPYPQQDAAVLGAVRKRSGKARPQWVKLADG